MWGGGFLDKSATCSSASTADVITTVWYDALISCFQSDRTSNLPHVPAERLHLDLTDPSSSSSQLSLVLGRRTVILDGLRLNPAPATWALCQKGTCFSSFCSLLYDVGWRSVACGGRWSSHEMMNVNMHKWHRAYKDEESRLLYFFSTYPPAQTPATMT